MILSFHPLWPVLLFLWTAWFVVLPGYFIAHLIWRDGLDLYERVGMSFALGFLIFSFLGLLGYLFRLPLNVLFWLSSSVTGLLGLAILLTRIFHRIHVAVRAKKLNWQIGLLLVFVALVGSLISLGSGWYPRGDAAIHLQAIRKMINQPALTQPIYSLNTRPVLWDHAYDSYYPLIALIARHSGLELTVVWHYLSAVLVLLLPFVIYALLKALGASRKLIFNSLLFFLLLGIFYPRPMYGTVFDALVYPNRVYLWLLLPIALVLFFRYLSHGKRSYGIATALVAAFQVLIHQNGFLFYYWILGGIFLLGVVLHKYRSLLIRRTASVLILTTTIALPLLLLKWPYDQGFVHLATSPAWTRYYHFWYVNKTLYAFDPSTLWHLDMLVGLVVAIIVIYRMFRARTAKPPFKDILLVVSFIIPPLVVFNPLVMPMIASVFSYPSVGRMLRIPLYYLAYAYGVGMILAVARRLIKTGWAWRMFEVGFYLTVCGVFIFAAKPGYSVLQHLNFNHQLPPITRVVSHLKPGSLVLSDSLTSTDVVEFADVYSLVMKFNGPVDLIDITAGQRVVDQILHQPLSPKTVAQILKKEGVDYIVVDKRSGLSKDIGVAYPSLLKTIYYDQNYKLYEVNFGDTQGRSS